MDSNAFLNDLMSKMKLSEAKGKKKAEQSESVAQILAVMQKVKTEKKKPPVTSYAPVKEMPMNEPESMEEFSQLASDVMQECRPAMPTVSAASQEKAVRVAAYIRVSSTNPAQEDSYEMQERYFMSLLAGNAGWTSAGIYSDHGISATSREGRTGFNRLLRHCKQGKIDRVICKSISRFARNTQDFLVALRTLKENNVTILFEREAMDTADAYSEFILTTLAAIAQEESRSISANIAWSNQKRFPAGNVCNKDIYGYEFRKGEYTVNENGYRYRAVFIIPEEAEIVRMVFRLFTKEELSFTQIAQKLDALHIPPPNSGCRQRQKRKPTVLPAGALKEEDKRGWTATDVRYMIANVRYCGSVLCQKTYTDHRNGHKQKVNKGEKPKYLIRNHHPAIIRKNCGRKHRKSGRHTRQSIGASKREETKETIPSSCCVENADGIFKAILQQGQPSGGVRRSSPSRDRSAAEWNRFMKSRSRRCFAKHLPKNSSWVRRWMQKSMRSCR